MKKIMLILVLIIVLVVMGIFAYISPSVGILNMGSQNINPQQNYSNGPNNSNLHISNSSVTFNSDLRKISDGSITFNYAGNFKQTDPHAVIGDVDWVNVINLMDGNTRIDVTKYTIRTDPNTERELTENSPPGDPYSTILSHTTEINPNGVEVFKSVNKIQEQDGSLKYIDFYFKDKKGVVYYISVYDYESNFQKVNDIANVIFNSLNTK